MKRRDLGRPLSRQQKDVLVLPGCRRFELDRKGGHSSHGDPELSGENIDVSIIVEGEGDRDVRWDVCGDGVPLGSEPFHSRRIGIRKEHSDAEGHVRDGSAA